MDLRETVELPYTMAGILSIQQIGSSRNRVIYHSNFDGAFTLWSVDVEDGSKIRITPGPVKRMAEPRHDSNTVYYTKHAAKGAELHKVFSADAIKCEEPLAVDSPLVSH